MLNVIASKCLAADGSLAVRLDQDSLQEALEWASSQLEPWSTPGGKAWLV